jgi:hypothetical protein
MPRPVSMYRDIERGYILVYIQTGLWSAKKEDGYPDWSSHPVCITLEEGPGQPLFFRRRHILASPSLLVGCLVQGLLLRAYHIADLHRAPQRA